MVEEISHSASSPIASKQQLPWKLCWQTSVDMMLQKKHCFVVRILTDSVIWNNVKTRVASRVTRSFAAHLSLRYWRNWITWENSFEINISGLELRSLFLHPLNKFFSSHKILACTDIHMRLLLPIDCKEAAIWYWKNTSSTVEEYDVSLYSLMLRG